MSERLPPAKVIVPIGDKAVMLAMLGDQSRELTGAKKREERGSSDGRRAANQARSNCDELLDHYPNGSPRDHIVAYGGECALANTDPRILDNIRLGQE